MIKGLTKLLILSVLIFSASTPVYSSEEDEDYVPSGRYSERKVCDSPVVKSM